VPDVQEHDDQEVEGVQGDHPDREATVAVGGVPALDLDPHLSLLSPFRLVPGIGWMQIKS
jgi:hypothetical protein